MHDGQQLTIGTLQAIITKANLGQGGQGSVHLASPQSSPDIQIVLKEIGASNTVKRRVAALCELNLAGLSPFIAGPVGWNEPGNGTLLHVAPFAEGVPLEEDHPRSLPELLEIAHHAACQIVILEENGIAHGDIAPSNVLIAPDGAATLIDLDTFASLDPSVPDPLHIGQPPMMAPELRGGGVSPSILSDRFAFAVLLSWLLFGHHPVTDLATNPAETDTEMSRGKWPERRRARLNGETPIEALGPDLPKLFDAAFSRRPRKRPTADAWRRALVKALDTCWIHDCGQAFVRGPRIRRCPWCNGRLVQPGPAPKLRIILPETGGRFSISLEDGASVHLGRANLPGLPGTVSSRHLTLIRKGERLHLQHTGRHPTLIDINGQWHRLEDHEIGMAALHALPLSLLLADASVILEQG